ncbi:MAG TPA: site-specific integrase [Terriglobia bacterium]|nr:site-specific integrase [Terriglobia bacterium]
MTLRQLAVWYWQNHGQRKRSNGVKGTIERLTTYFGDTQLVGITPEGINSYRQERTKVDGVTERTVNRDLQELKTMFNKIIIDKRWRKVLENPVSYVKLSKECNERVRYLEPTQITTLLAKAPKHLKPIVITALHTGMRRGELLRLKWDDINFKENLLHVKESKNGEGRYIPLSDELRHTLLQLPSRFKGGLVFPSNKPLRKNRDGEQHPYRDVKNSFHATLAAAGITDFRFHDLRHTFASTLVMHGADLNTVRDLLGHKSIKMTLRYAHLSPKQRQAAITLINTAYGGTGTKTDTQEKRNVQEGTNLNK